MSYLEMPIFVTQFVESMNFRPLYIRPSQKVSAMQFFNIGEAGFEIETRLMVEETSVKKVHALVQYRKFDALQSTDKV